MVILSNGIREKKERDRERERENGRENGNQEKTPKLYDGVF
jgi:hypothetical protein